VHTVDQHLIFTSGICKAIVEGEERDVKAGDMVIVPQGTKHNCESLGDRGYTLLTNTPLFVFHLSRSVVHLALSPFAIASTRPRSPCSLRSVVVVNTGPTPLCLFTVYAPAEHAEKTVHKTKEEGDEFEEAGKDEAPKWAKS
jgi:mannose-6-phosphate isomerase-like protein (cupin superfamily)